MEEAVNLHMPDSPVYTKLQLRERLSGGQFRMLNEKLYTCSGQEALEYVKEDPEMFDMTSLESSSLDIVVFCLSLIGTNYSSYIKEAHRVLRPSGMLLIAEVKSIRTMEEQIQKTL